jgi:hypothetical protein
MIDIGFIHKPCKAADIGNKKQALVFHFFSLKLNLPAFLITDMGK